MTSSDIDWFRVAEISFRIYSMGVIAFGRAVLYLLLLFVFSLADR